MLYYIPLEHIDSRYTKHLDRDILMFLNQNKIKYLRIYPDLEPIPELRKIKDGSFLDAPTTIEFKSRQIAEISKLFYHDVIQDGDELFFSDIWFPGVESLAYLKYFCKKDIKLKGILHAGSFTDTDFVRDMERWAKNFEDILFDIFDEIYVASEFIKKDVIKKRLVNPEKIKVTPFKIDLDVLGFTKEKKENIVLFNGRNVDEKQPWLFEQLEHMVRLAYDGDVEFINTQKENLDKVSYYKLIGKSKVIVSFALQENFGFGVGECVLAGCIPILPNRLVYPELYEKKYLYDDFNDCVIKVVEALMGEYKRPLLDMRMVDNSSFKTWFL